MSGDSISERGIKLRNNYLASIIMIDIIAIISQAWAVYLGLVIIFILWWREAGIRHVIGISKKEKLSFWDAFFHAIYLEHYWREFSWFVLSAITIGLFQFFDFNPLTQSWQNPWPLLLLSLLFVIFAINMQRGFSTPLHVISILISSLLGLFILLFLEFFPPSSSTSELSNWIANSSDVSVSLLFYLSLFVLLGSIVIRSTKDLHSPKFRLLLYSDRYRKQIQKRINLGSHDSIEDIKLLLELSLDSIQLVVSYAISVISVIARFLISWIENLSIAAKQTFKELLEGIYLFFFSSFLPFALNILTSLLLWAIAERIYMYVYRGLPIIDFLAALTVYSLLTLSTFSISLVGLLDFELIKTSARNFLAVALENWPHALFVLPFAFWSLIAFSRVSDTYRFSPGPITFMSTILLIGLVLFAFIRGDSLLKIRQDSPLESKGSLPDQAFSHQERHSSFLSFIGFVALLGLAFLCLLLLGSSIASRGSAILVEASPLASATITTAPESPSATPTPSPTPNPTIVALQEEIAAFDSPRHWDENAIYVEGHTDRVRAATWSPDGNFLATSANDGSVRIWDTEHFEQLEYFYSGSRQVIDVSWSPTGEKLAAAAGYQLIIWGTQNWDKNVYYELKGNSHYGDWFNSVSWSPDGRLLAVGLSHGSLAIFDSETGQILDSFPGRSKALWQNNGNTIFTASRYSIQSYDLTSGRVTYSQYSLSPISSLALSPDETWIVSEDRRGEMIIWDSETLIPITTIEGFSHNYCNYPPEPEGEVLLWDDVTCSMLRWSPRNAQLSPDGSQLVITYLWWGHWSDFMIFRSWKEYQISIFNSFCSELSLRLHFQGNAWDFSVPKDQYISYAFPEGTYYAEIVSCEPNVGEIEPVEIVLDHSIFWQIDSEDSLGNLSLFSTESNSLDRENIPPVPSATSQEFSNSDATGEPASLTPEPPAPTIQTYTVKARNNNSEYHICIYAGGILQTCRQRHSAYDLRLPAGTYSVQACVYSPETSTVTSDCGQISEVNVQGNMVWEFESIDSVSFKWSP